MSTYDKHKSEGNKIIQSLDIESDFDVFKDKVYLSINFYNKAGQHCKSIDEYCKIFKNILVSNTKLFLKVIRDIPLKKNFDFLMYLYKEILTMYLNFLTNYNFYLKNEDIQIYLSQLHKISSIFITFLNQKGDSFTSSVKYLNSLKKIVPWECLNITFLLERSIALKYFHEGIELFEKKEYNKAQMNFNHSLEILRHIIYLLDNHSNYDSKIKKLYQISSKDNFNYSDIEELISYDKLNHEAGYQESFLKGEFAEQIHQLIIDTETYMIKSDIFIKFEHGNKHLSLAIEEDETIDMENIFISLDYYRESYNLVVNVLNTVDTKYNADIELEALIAAKIGYLTFRVFKNYNKANTLLSYAINLGLSLYPKNIASESWYIKAVQCLEEIRKILYKEKDEEDKKVNQQFYIELENELKQLDLKTEETLSNVHANIGSFLKYLQENHKPENKEMITFLDDELKDKPKKVLLKFCKFYHPDANKDQTKKKYFEIQEVSKRLNNLFGYFK